MARAPRKTTRRTRKPERKPDPFVGGRPPEDLDVGQVRALSIVQCTFAEMAAALGVHVDTISRRYKSDPSFAKLIDDARGSGLTSLRRKMWREAFRGAEPDPLPADATEDEQEEHALARALSLDPKHRAIALKAQQFLSQQYLDMKSKHGIGGLDGGPLVDIDAALASALERGLSADEREQLEPGEPSSAKLER